MGTKLTKEQFIKLANEKHNNKYNYDQIEYSNTITKIKIICPIHQEFWQTPKDHKNGQGCPQCGKLKREKSRRKNFNKPERDWLYQKYIIENLDIYIVSEMAECSTATISRCMREYKIPRKNQKNAILNTKKTINKNYGVDNISQSSEVKEKKKATFLQNYGFECNLQVPEIKEKIKQTCLKRYGVEYASQSKNVIEKIKKINLEKYGNFSSLHGKNEDKIRKILIKNNLKKYGVNNVFLVPEIRIKLRQGKIEKGYIDLIFGKSIIEWSKIYPNISIAALYNLKKKKLDIINNEEKFIDYLKNYKKSLSDIENIISNEFNIPLYDKNPNSYLSYKPDFKLNEKLYLNVDGLYWHSEACKDNDYHFKMRQNYENLGLRIFQFRADEVYNKIEIIKSIINNALGKTKYKIGARKTKILKVNTQDAEVFLNQNHMKGHKNAKHLGLYYKNELVSIMSYKLGLNKSDKSSYIKIERFCSKLNYNIIGAFSKLLKAIEGEYKIKLPIHYWVDLRYGTGKFLLNNGFNVVKDVLGWEWTDGEKTFNRLKCRANMDERFLSERKYASEIGLVKIFDAGQRLYVKLITNTQI